MTERLFDLGASVIVRTIFLTLGAGILACGTLANAAPPPPHNPVSSRPAATVQTRAETTAAAPAAGGPEGRPIGNVGDWFAGDTYPAQARASGAQGRTAFRVDLDPRGRITSCNIVQSSGSPLLDSQTCTILVTKGRFTPARNAAGQPVAGSWSSAMVWRLAAAPVAADDLPDMDRDYNLHDSPVTTGSGGGGGGGDGGHRQGGGHRRGGGRS